MPRRFNPAPGWPTPPEGWLPPAGWQPDPSWPPAPPGWQVVVDDSAPSGGLGSLKARAQERFMGGSGVDSTSDPNMVWEGRGQPLKGIGAGRYKLTRSQLYFEKGTFSTDAQQVPVVQIIDVDLRQTMTQKARGMGTLAVHVQRHGGTEVVLIEDIPEPRQVQQMINDVVREARVAVQQAANTHHYSQAAPPVAAAPGAGSASPDPIEQLRRLGELRDAGVLTPEEFEAKKADILGRM